MDMETTTDPIMGMVWDLELRITTIIVIVLLTAVVIMVITITDTITTVVTTTGTTIVILTIVIIGVLPEAPITGMIVGTTRTTMTGFMCRRRDIIIVTKEHASLSTHHASRDCQQSTFDIN